MARKHAVGKSNVEISDVTSIARCRSHVRVWTHYGFKITFNEKGVRIKLSGKVICRLCDGDFNFIEATTNMATHLLRPHSIHNKKQKVTQVLYTVYFYNFHYFQLVLLLYDNYIALTGRIFYVFEKMYLNYLTQRNKSAKKLHQ